MHKPLAKSLHTVTVLVALARTVPAAHQYQSAAQAVAMALDILGLAGAPDVYGLAAQAVAKLEKERAAMARAA